VLFQARVYVLVAALAATALALYAVIAVKDTNLTGFLRVAAVPIAMWACGAYALLLSARLAAFAVIAPVLAWLWWVAAMDAGGFWPLPHQLLAASYFAMIVAGACLAAKQAHAMADALVRGMDAPSAMEAALAQGARFGVLAVLAPCAGIAAAAYPEFRFAPVLGVGALLMFLAAFLLPPIAASFLPVDEAFIARANRARELQQRFIFVFTVFSISRWAFATVGIAAVLLTVVYFDSAFAPLWQAAMLPYAMAFAGVGLLGAIGLRDWRNFFSCGATLFTATILGAWAAARLGLAPGDASLLSLLVGSSAGAAFVHCLAAPMAAYRRAGDPVAIAYTRALNEAGICVFILAGALAAALLAGAALQKSPLAAAVLPLFHIGGALVLFPALAAALDDLFPPRRSLEELYRVR
jgi:hypothetical protein